ncbi:MAG: double zinc ribbon domain-containing protein [Chloroflexota bacterium]
MEALGEAIGDALATIVGDPVAGLLVRLAAAYWILIWLAAALWAFVDTRRRTTSLVAAYGSAALVILATPLLFPAALLVHVVLRPEGFAADRRVDDLRLAALSEEGGPRCPGCERAIDDDWLVCPTCRRQLAHRCHSCGGSIGLDWTVCGWCGAELDGTTFPARGVNRRVPGSRGPDRIRA